MNLVEARPTINFSLGSYTLYLEYLGYGIWQVSVSKDNTIKLRKYLQDLD